MKFRLIALAACCAFTSSAFALQDDPYVHPPQAQVTDDPYVHPPQAQVTDDPYVHPPQLALRVQ
jgi:hypothetical protein